MLVFGVAILDEEKYRRYALPGIRRIAEPNSVLIEKRGGGSLQKKYNSVLEEAGGYHDLEAVVLPHEDVEIADDDFVQTVRRRLRDPTIAILGVVGGRGVRTAAWASAAETFGHLTVTRAVPHFEERVVESVLFNVPLGVHEVEAVDGILLVLSPWAVRELRFDDAFSEHFHGYDADLCFQARERGRRVVVEQLEVIHHTSGLRSSGWVEADVLWQRKWRAARGPDEPR
jgi:GT2 family glycosyltransferase